MGEGGRVENLSPEEERVLERAREESRRISREELPRMFLKRPIPRSKDRVSGEWAEQTPPLGLEQGSLSSRSLLRVLELVNRPFRWVSPVWRTGLGLCGVLLLITLLLVILLRTL